MGDTKIVKMKNGKVLGRSFLIDGQDFTQSQALEHLKKNGFSEDEARQYLESLPIWEARGF